VNLAARRAKNAAVRHVTAPLYSERAREMGTPAEERRKIIADAVNR